MRFPDKHAARDKRLLALERELNRLAQASRATPIVPLARPYRRGWMKTFALRDDVARRRDAAAFRAALKLVNREIPCRTRAFLGRDGTPLELRPRIIPAAEWRASALPLAQQRLFGLGHWPVEAGPFWWCSSRAHHHVFGYRLLADWWLREDIQPLLVTHQRVELPEVRRRIAEIEAHLQATAGWCRLSRLHGRSQWWRRESLAPALRRAARSFAEQTHESSPD